jgi:hypothetical protein
MMVYRRYGYPWRWAIPAEFFWRVEHTPGSTRLRRFGYRLRKRCEHRGYAAGGRLP